MAAVTAGVDETPGGQRVGASFSPPLDQATHFLPSLQAQRGGLCPLSSASGNHPPPPPSTPILAPSFLRPGLRKLNLQDSLSIYTIWDEVLLESPLINQATLLFNVFVAV